MRKFLLPFLLIANFAHADVSVPRAKQYLWTQLDATLNGAQGTHNMGVYLPAGAIITDAYLYINTQFASSGTDSLAFGCSSTTDLMAYNSVKNVALNKAYQAHSGSAQLGVTGSGSYIGEVASAGLLDFSLGYGSIPTACQVTATVRTGGGFTPYTAGNATFIVEYFLK
jgi:hypothetical protein